MNKTAITSPELAPPVGPFSQAIEVGGFLYFSGQVGQDPATGKVVFPPAQRSRWPRCPLGPALRSTSWSRLEATHGG